MSDTVTPPELPEPMSAEGAAVLRAFESIGAILGGALEWDGADTLDAVAEAYNAACRKLGLPEVSDQGEAALRYWSSVGDRYGIDHDDLDALYGSDGDEADR